MKISLIVPCYNEAENVFAFQDAAIEAFKDSSHEYEIVYIDDGSCDGTFLQLKTIFDKQLCPVKVVRFSRNFGKDSGIYAGLKYASGDYVSIIDVDLQQQPSLVLQMVKFLEENPDFDMVAAYQDRRKESKLLSFFKKGFYSLINHLSDVEIHANASDFRTMRRRVVESILKLTEYHRFSKGIFAWVGFNTHYIPYQVQKRFAGTSKWNFRKLLNYGIDGIIGHSTKPLRIATVLGTLTAIAAVIYMIAVILEKFITGIDIPGYATIIVLILLLGGMQLFCIGIIGEYVELANGEKYCDECFTLMDIVGNLI